MDFKRADSRANLKRSESHNRTESMNLNSVLLRKMSTASGFKGATGEDGLEEFDEIALSQIISEFIPNDLE